MLRKMIVIRIYVLLIMTAVFLNVLPSFSYPLEKPYNQNWYIRVDRSEAANADRKMYDPPAVGEEPKELNKMQRILLRANKPHRSRWYRYGNDITMREYTDCSYYKYVDCSNFAFCRCWQCKYYAYPIVRTDY